MKLITILEASNTWKIYHNDAGTLEAQIVSFDESSQYGINNGKISKLYFYCALIFRYVRFTDVIYALIIFPNSSLSISIIR